METCEYATMARLETTYWWYRGQREMVCDCLASLPRRSHRPILDAGCGTGRMRELVAERLRAEVMGVDVSSEATAFWSPLTARHACLASADRLPFADRSFEIAYSIDVLCCREVDPAGACAELVRVIEPGGWLVLVVPAYPWLLSEHDRAVHCVRRFSRHHLRQIVASAGLRIERLTHLFPSFFPAIAAVRLLRRRRSHNGNGQARSDLRELPQLVNRVLFGVTQVERGLVRHLDFPWGTSLMAVAVKR